MIKQSLRQIIGILLLAALATVLVHDWQSRHAPKAPSEDRVSLRDIEWAEAANRSPPTLWIDARRSRDYREAHIPGALPLSEDEWEQRFAAVIQAWHPGMRVVVYCQDSGCGASRAVARRLGREMGLPEVYVLQGGWKSWTERRTQ